MDGKRKQQAVDALAAIYLEGVRADLAEWNADLAADGDTPFQDELRAAVRKQAECEPS